MLLLKYVLSRHTHQFCWLHGNLKGGITVTAVVFGAGAVGLGFLGELLSRSVYQLTYVDIDLPLVRELNEHGSYVFNKVGCGLEPVVVDGVRAICPDQPTGPQQLTTALTEAQVAFTASSARALPAVAALLARSLAMIPIRPSPLNVFCCENHRDAALALRDATEKAWGEEASLTRQVRFVNTVVARMCQRLTTTERDLLPVTPNTDMVILAENYDRLPANGDAAADLRPVISGLEYFSAAKFAAWDERKLFAHNGIHALIAVLGKLAGCQYFCQAAEDPDISASTRRAMWDEVGRALVSEYPRFFSAQDFDDFATDLYSRLISPQFADTVDRGTRGSLRMIQPEDGRLSRAAQFVASQGIVPSGLCLGIAGVMRLNGLTAADIPSTLQEADSGLSPDLSQLVTAAYTALGHWQSGQVGSLTAFVSGD